MRFLVAAAILVWAIDRAGKSMAWRWVGFGSTRRWGRLAIRPARHAAVAQRSSRLGHLVGWLSAVAAAVLLMRWQSGHTSPSLEIGLGAAIGGAAGNLFDLWRHRAVLDFLDLGLGCFNPADVGIVVGVAAVFLALVPQA